ncbi:hypothetical protein E2562_036187 [Oryza meyeriana var. granulata]|uniref:Uncharacterized protein n=1 Tax=Oryza meyeriana var. granulata TaxID=110450 RepID=A0A6G1E7C5_9ORYZ|nr:hypothetical protein E2562_036187 [Oryza meyeriana var. granulata]
MSYGGGVTDAVSATGRCLRWPQQLPRAGMEMDPLRHRPREPPAAPPVFILVRTLALAAALLDDVADGLESRVPDL